MRSDSDIRRDVEDELRWDPDIDATDVAVSVNNGVVTLAGFVRSYTQKYQAEVDAKRVAGVLAVANDLEVRLPNIDERPDPEIARDAITRIKSELPYAWEEIRVVAKNGWLTLEGEVEWNYQRERAEEAVRRVRGVKGITNSIEVKPRVAPMEISARSKRHCGEPPRSTPAASRSRPTERGDPAGHRALVGRTPGSGESGLVGAGGIEGRQSNHRQSLTEPLTGMVELTPVWSGRRA
jgi:osmotically-inducible protein OsmY